ncbi:hypothetical protein DY245_40885 [Streptomyces inhibens]|uniref:Extensin n=1 Tax=Streptomyces inhibens TaxID=2293571 RepID=A0A371PRZ5_STRIH|nr:hypothetical protein [Streptomyces inhibens]REK84883.1 hypothetical protein DY245_40885 [Streptomyces inhibens]
MADDRYNWLDKDAAEQLLRGEPVSARHGDGARELEQLLKAAAAACAEMSKAAELPGEEAAVAAFRRARAGARHRATGEPLPAVHAAPTTSIAERTRLARPFRRGLAVALAACAIGGVAVAAGTGVLPTPFRGGDPAPGSSVSAAETPGPLDTREPGAQTDGTTAQTPDSTPGQQSTGPGSTPTPGSSSGATRTPGTGKPGRGTGHSGGAGDGGANPGRGDKKKLLLSLCRAYESGKRDQMDRDTLRRLESKAGGPEKVHAFCRAYLARYEVGGGSGDNDGFGGVGGSDPSGSGSGGDEDDDEHPSQSPGSTPGPGTSTPAPGPSATATDPANATPGATATSTV